MQAPPAPTTPSSIAPTGGRGLAPTGAGGVAPAANAAAGAAAGGQAPASAQGSGAASSPPPIAAAPVPQLSPFDREWRKWLHDGLVPNTAFAPRTVAVQSSLTAAQSPVAGGLQASGQGLEVVFRADPGIHDGRFA